MKTNAKLSAIVQAHLWFPPVHRLWAPVEEQDIQYCFQTASGTMWDLDHNGELHRNFGYDPELLESFCKKGSWRELK
jgi:hypothetical protein